MMTSTFPLNSLSARQALIISLLFTGMVNEAKGREYFNPALLEKTQAGNTDVDLSAFEAGYQAAGTYHVDILLNGQIVDTRDVTFTRAESGALQPCLSVAQLQGYGLKVAQYPGLSAGECADLSVIPQASSDLLFTAQKLAISVPQAALSVQARGYVDPALWDDGIVAALLNYSLSGDNSRDRERGVTDNSQYVNLRPGINVGPWRLRNYTTWNRDTQGNNNWDRVYTYAQRSLVSLKAQLVLGDSTSPADVFDSVPFRGAQMASDDEMIPDSLKGYAPVVRGIARTHAQIVIRQNGYQIYQNYVSPGAFEITDMYPTGGGGDFEVTLYEADGSEQHFTVPYASLPVLQREGRLKYALTAGRYRAYDSSVDDSPFAQATAIYGLPKGFTLYGGTQLSSTYRALAAGAGKNLGTPGALSADVTQSWAEPGDGEKAQGQSWRLRYSKNNAASGTNMAVTGYRYSTRNYYAMQDVFEASGGGVMPSGQRRNRMEATVSQSLGPLGGTLSLSAVREDYWRGDRPTHAWSVSYNNSWKGMSYAIAWTQTRNGGQGSDGSGSNNRQVAVNISIPLDRFMTNTWASYGMNTSRHNGTTHTVGLSGTALAGNALSWNLQQGTGTDDQDYTGSLNADYKGTYAQVSGGYSVDSVRQRLSYSVAGGVLAHADGVTLSQPLSETNVLIKAPGAAHVGVTNQSGVRTDFRGYTVAGNVSPYRKNDIGLDTATVPGNVELALTNKTVVPTRGAVVRADFVASVGLRALLTLRREQGQPVPFGAMVSVAGAQGQQFIVGDEGQVFLSGLQPQGVLDVVWGNTSQQRCRAKYSLAAAENYADVRVSHSVCR